MESIDVLQAKLQALSDDRMSRFINEAVKQIEKTVIELITKGQVYKGKLADGSKIRPLDRSYPVYHPMYEAYKSQLARYQGHVDLSLSGEFLKSWVIIYDADGFTIKAGTVIRDGKDLAEHLRGRYGDFEEISNENMEALRGMIKQALIRQLRDYIGIN